MNLEISIEYSDDCCDCCDCEEEPNHRCESHREKWNEDEVRFAAKQCTDAVFSHLDIKGDFVEICFLFTDNETVRLLNKTYRGIDKPTNVLSFPANPIEDLDDENNNFGDYYFQLDETDGNPETAKPFLILGSMAFAYETVVREAIEQNKKFADHLQHLIVHSLLHLLNYDHIDEADAAEMESLEVAILKKMNISNPYELN